MQCIASQSIGKIKSAWYILEDGITLQFYLNGVKQDCEYKLKEAWNLPAITQLVRNGKLIVKIDGIVVAKKETTYKGMFI